MRVNVTSTPDSIVCVRVINSQDSYTHNHILNVIIGLVIGGRGFKTCSMHARPQLIVKGNVSMRTVYRMTFLSLFTLRGIIHKGKDEQ